MKITKLPAGQTAPKDSDCIKIERIDDGLFTITTSGLVDCRNDDGEEAESEAVISSDSYDTYEEAEAAGLAWAENVCLKEVYVETYS